MNKQEMRGRGKQIEGTVREGVGKLTGNKKEELKGKIQKTEGKVNERIGRWRRKTRI
jgi:uncharacterized protein YjbJ (UPF0337 family)